MKKKHREMMAHYATLIDRYRWPNYELTERDLMRFIERESTGKAVDVPEPLLWAKKTEEITIQQQWHEMAEWWADGSGWWPIWRDNLSRAWSARRGTNIWVRKILAQARLVKKHGGFMEAMMECTAFTRDDRMRYLNRRFGPA